MQATYSGITGWFLISSWNRIFPSLFHIRIFWKTMKWKIWGAWTWRGIFVKVPTFAVGHTTLKTHNANWRIKRIFFVILSCFFEVSSRVFLSNHDDFHFFISFSQKSSKWSRTRKPRENSKIDVWFLNNFVKKSFGISQINYNTIFLSAILSYYANSTCFQTLVQFFQSVRIQFTVETKSLLFETHDDCNLLISLIDKQDQNPNEISFQHDFLCIFAEF